MIDQVANLVSQLVVIPVLGGDDGFGGLFAYFFKILSMPFSNKYVVYAPSGRSA